MSSSENQDRLRVGIVGCGYQGGILDRTIAEGNTFQVTACADPDRDWTKGRARPFVGRAGCAINGRGITVNCSFV